MAIPKLTIEQERKLSRQAWAMTKGCCPSQAERLAAYHREKQRLYAIALTGRDQTSVVHLRRGSTYTMRANRDG